MQRYVVTRGEFQRWALLALWVGGCLGLGLSASGADAETLPVSNLRGPALTLTEENDWIAGTDRHYTQGLRFTYLGSEHREPGWLKDFPSGAFHVQTWRWGGELGQAIYTPEDLKASIPLPDDRPYAGWLYGGVILQRRGATPESAIPVLENIRLQLGVVGPGSLAKEEQNAAHFVGGFGQAEGWHNQLGNEPGFALKYQRAWRLAPGTPREWTADFIPHAGGSLGNVDTSARVGATLRAGWHLPDDFGVQTIDSLGVTDGGRTSAEGRRRGFYFFGRVEERAVARNEFLDGSMFRRNSPQVDRRPFVCELQGGAVLVLGRLDVALVLVYRTKEFDGQTCEDTFGSLSVSMNF